jgi:C4-type Zn-finger protein
MSVGGSMETRFERERLAEEVSEMKQALESGKLGEGALYQIEKTLVELRTRVKPNCFESEEEKRKKNRKQSYSQALIERKLQRRNW